MDNADNLSLDGKPLLGSILSSDPLMKGISAPIGDNNPLQEQKPRKDSALFDPKAEDIALLWAEEAREKSQKEKSAELWTPPTHNRPDSPSPTPFFNAIDPLTGTVAQSSLAGSDVTVSRSQPTTDGTTPPRLTAAQQSASASSSLSPSPLVSHSSITWSIKAEGTVTVNGGGDFDGEPTNPTDDALIYAGSGFTLNGKMVLPVKRDAAGNPLVDRQNQPILVDKAVAVAAGYRRANVLLASHCTSRDGG